MSKLILENFVVYEFIRRYGRKNTYSTPREVVQITHGKKIQYIVPHGEGYNCEDGFSLDILTEQEFNKEYSFEYIK